MRQDLKRIAAVDGFSLESVPCHYRTAWLTACCNCLCSHGDTLPVHEPRQMNALKGARIVQARSCLTQCILWHGMNPGQLGVSFWWTGCMWQAAFVGARRRWHCI